MSHAAATAGEEWKSGWTMVMASTTGFFFFSITTATMGVFMGPIGEEFGWSRTLLSAGITISGFVTALLSPPFGLLIDRFGSRKLAIPGTIVTSLGIAAIALANGSAMQWLALWGIYALISISVKTTVWTTAVSGVFTAGRGLALGIMLCGTAAAQIVCPPLANWLIAEYGWRMAYVALGLGFGAITLLLCLLFFYDAHDRRAAAAAEKPGAGTRPDFPGLSVAQAWRDTALWRIALATFLLMLLAIGLQIHQVPVLVEAGVSRTNAAWLASLAGAAGIVGKLVTGQLLDHFRANWVGGLTLGANALAFLLLLTGTHSPPLIVLAMVVNGYAAGTKLHICTYLTSRYAGLRNFGVIYGFMTAVVAFGSGTGPMVAGLVHDLAGNYGPFLLAGTIGCVIAGLLVFSLPGYPDWENKGVPPLAPAAG